MSESKEVENESTVLASSGEPPHPLTRQKIIERWFEVITAIMLGVVVVATAWSGYQAARWDGEQAAKYAQASTLRVDSTRYSTQAGQVALYDTGVFNQWLNAYSHGETKLTGLYERRFRPEFRPAFQAWLATDPFNNPNAPPGPLLMPQYKLSLAEKANQLEVEAGKTFEEGQAANQQSDDYVLDTVVLATVLFLIAISERFEWHAVRSAILLIALGILLVGLYHLATYPIN
jgi:hypothetical protein